MRPLPAMPHEFSANWCRRAQQRRFGRALPTERVHTNAVCLCITSSFDVLTHFTVAARVRCYHFVMHILQVTDPHLSGIATGRLRGVDTDASLRAVIDDAFARVPDYSA